MQLAELQEQLSQQYARLRDLRATEDYPVYAIEHGLTAQEVAAAQALLNIDLNSTMRANRAFWLVWIAAAAEVGYRYDGTEYWDSFAAAFPQWPRFGDRNLVRTWYKRFEAEFRGLAPSGHWARQFPIIAWPITQAILPRYLQRHFADHLYDLRHTLAGSGELTLAEIGDLLSERYYGGSSRFEGFLQQKPLTARIVMALRLEDFEDAISPIDKTTLHRIIADFDKLGSFGIRLREARRALREARFINSFKPGFVPKAKNAQENPAVAADSLERPRLLARQVGATTWHLTLALPDLATVLRKAGLSARDLERSRMRFRLRGEGSTWTPGRALFSYCGGSEEPLTAYPTNDVTIFEFDRPLEKVAALLSERLFVPAASFRLLKVRADGTAVEIAGRHVRANQSYILVTSDAVDIDSAETLALSPVQTETKGAHAWQLSVPAKLSPETIAALRAIGLGYALGIRAEPLGLTARWNDPDQTLVFLDTEVVMFAIVSDVVVGAFRIAVGADPPVRLAPALGGSSLVSLGKLPVGLHRVSVCAQGTATGGDIVAEEILLRVRPVSPWQKSVSGKAGVALMLEPREATLDQFLDGNARLCVRAPAGRTIKLEGRFYGADGTLFHQESIGTYNTPVSDARVSDFVLHKLITDEQVEYMERSARIEIIVSLDEYGNESVGFDKEAEPLRWLRVDERTIRLSDDTGQATSPKVTRYDLDAAEIGQEVAYEEAVSGIELRAKGGLFVASFNGRRYEAVATGLHHHLSDFSDLGVPARLSAGARAPVPIINAMKHWRGVRRLIGPMAFLARRNAIRALEEALELLLCGNDWIAAVSHVRAGTREIGDLYGRVYFSRGFAAGLRGYQWQYDSDLGSAESEFLRLILLYEVPAAGGLHRLALKLAFRPHAVNPTDLTSPDALRTLKNSALIRGAYFARLAADLRTIGAKSEAA